MAFEGNAMKVSPWAGKPAEPSMLVIVPKLITTNYTEAPDPSVPEQWVAFGNSGHCGFAFERAFNASHILAISQAICLYRAQTKIDGPGGYIGKLPGVYSASSTLRSGRL